MQQSYESDIIEESSFFKSEVVKIVTSSYIIRGRQWLTGPIQKLGTAPQGSPSGPYARRGMSFIWKGSLHDGYFLRESSYYCICQVRLYPLIRVSSETDQWKELSFKYRDARMY